MWNKVIAKFSSPAGLGRKLRRRYANGSERAPISPVSLVVWQQDRISYCILTEADIERGDAHLQDVIQLERRAWNTDALKGLKHAFVVALISEALANAEPDETMRQIAERLCNLYLFDQPNEPKRHDSLRAKTENRAFRWLVGVNVFASAADGRWWNDHRIPGGLAFSMNSVGHMTFVRHLNKFPTMGTEPGQALVNWALPMAMRTIHTASKGSYPGTCLVERPRASSMPGVSEETRDRIFRDVPEDIRSRALRDLAGFSEQIYQGWYDTDETIPETYFRPEAVRPSDASAIPLYFTYLHSYADADYETMGLGERLFASNGDSEETGAADTEDPGNE